MASYEKLVRDKIPEILDVSVDMVRLRKLNDRGGFVKKFILKREK